MRRVKRLLIGVWKFVVGDDWRTAIGVALALGVTALVSATASSAWWIMPPAVIALLALSLRRAVRALAEDELCHGDGSQTAHVAVSGSCSRSLST